MATLVAEINGRQGSLFPGTVGPDRPTKYGITIGGSAAARAAARAATLMAPNNALA